MTYKRFEDLPVWQAAAQLYERTDDFLANPLARLRASFRDQLERAVLSISNNIAEGFERGTTSELLQFIYISRGSSGEVRSMLSLLKRRPWTKPLENELTSLASLAESCSRQLRAWAESLQNCEIQGQRHLNEKAKRQYDQRRRAEAMQKKLLSLLPPDHPLRRNQSQS